MSDAKITAEEMQQARWKAERYLLDLIQKVSAERKGTDALKELAEAAAAVRCDKEPVPARDNG